jgi:Protein of unknown function (DUF3306)
MTEREGFLQRWSRRKRERAEPGSPHATERDVTDLAARVAANHGDVTPPASAAATDIAVDLSKLPSIESITAATDIRPFLAPGVPAELSRAALRRAWAADPAIRDFVGLGENQWDFTAPGGVPGFGSLGNADEVRRMLAEIIREDHPRQAEQPQLPSQDSATPRSIASAPQAAGEARVEKLDAPQQSSNPMASLADNAAPQNKDDVDPQPPRRHGSALPE